MKTQYSLAAPLSRSHFLIQLFIAASLVASYPPGSTCSSAQSTDGAKVRVTTAGLLSDMVQLDGMAEFPVPGYSARQFSSYDRASKSRSEDWFANGDAGKYLRTEERDGRKEFVMMDAAGPGVITRIWSANPAGTLRIYLDEQPDPVLEAPMQQLLGGSFPGLPKPIAGEYSKGWNLYFPIPYSKRCVVTSDKGDFYYHVNYRTYVPDTQVQSFQAADLRALSSVIEKLAVRLQEPRTAQSDSESETEPYEIELGPGESVREEFEGSKAFTRAVVKLQSSDLEAALRGVLVRITFDGELCVESPLGDLFGSGPGLNPFSTLPVGMTKEEMYCHWLMPFRESAIIELTNHAKVGATLSGEIALRSYRWNENSMHFHARWRTESGVPTRPMQDWNYLTAKGRGVFAGASFTIDNPVKEWWGEGDEKIYVDGETFPSHFGTGTEDYFGYAWCWPGLFAHAYHAQPRCDGPGNYGRTSVNRFHILDRIPFSRDFKFDMELWHWNSKCHVNMAVVAYWYARPGATDGFAAIRPTDLIVRPLPPYVAPRVAGALEGESLQIMAVTGTAEPQDWNGLSGERHLWWHAGMKPGDVLKLQFSAPRSGKYHVLARFLYAKDYGVHQLAINGLAAGKPMDFYNSEVRPGAEVDLGVFALSAEINQLTATVVGANSKAIPAYMLGLDYLLLKPAE